MNVRRGALAGAIVAVVLSATLAASSSNPVETFAIVLAVAVAMGAAALGVVGLIDRRGAGRA